MNLLNLLSTLVLTSLSLLVLQPVAYKMGLIDEPGGRKTHEAATPLIGGVGIYVGIVLVTFFEPAVLNHYAPLLALSGVILFVGILDDLREISVRSRMLAQGGAALLMAVLAGNQLLGFGDLLGFGPIGLGVLAVPLTAFATVGVINAVNMSDGMDGLCGGMVVIALSFLAIMAFQAGDTVLLVFIATLIFSLLGFLALNNRLLWRRPALVYLGDAGSTFLGFVMAWLLIEGSQGARSVMPPVLALWFLAVPLIDTVYLLVTRPLRGQSPFTPGRDHVHHKLLRAGLSVSATVTVLYGVGIALGLGGLIAHRLGASESQLFYAFLGLFVLYALLSAGHSGGRERESQLAG